MDECQSQYGAKYDEEFPEIMIYSLPTPFYIDRPINHELMKKTIIKGLKKLESVGANFIAMPCNSAHIYFKELKESISIPLLNIVEETVKDLPSTPQKVTLLSKSSTFESKIYQKGITDAGHKFIFKDEWQKKINALIQNIKTDKNNPQNINILNEFLESVKFESIENIVIACTDLNVVLEKIQPSINIIDSSKCLAESVIKKYLELEK
ncbi:amino acid racemase [Clostridioides sp. ZZV15-6388]|uniref:aspartate/glutamate racemase family protein n=1 Tax=Clostridioides sp. ZZV15-6388 TaxID=2811499 RepID=UPI001D0FCE8E